MTLSETLSSINENLFSVEVFGLGYVGFPLAVKLANSGIKVVGIDVNAQRVERLKNNNLMDSETYLENEFLKCRQKNNLEISEKSTKSSNPKIGIICVPTPIPDQKITSDVYVKSAVETFLNNAKSRDVIILESSIEVGTTEKIKDVIESKGYRVGEDFGLCFCPERVDPNNKEWGIENIPRVIYCSDDTSFKIAKNIYTYVNKANLIRVDAPKIAEVVKSFENAFRLVNISLVNELAILCDTLGINVKNVIDAAATKPFGFLPHYPGAGAGGHCIPKDPRFLLESAKNYDVNFSTIENALSINTKMPKYVANSIEGKFNELGLEKTVLVCGLSYKANVEDMRDSASFKIINELTGKGFQVSAHDPFFNMDFVEKYLTENHIDKINFDLKTDLSDNNLQGINCLCIVQHHDATKNRLDEIYSKSLVPFIYDCQSKLKSNEKYSTILDMLGD